MPNSVALFWHLALEDAIRRGLRHKRLSIWGLEKQSCCRSNTRSLSTRASRGVVKKPLFVICCHHQISFPSSQQSPGRRKSPTILVFATFRASSESLALESEDIPGRFLRKTARIWGSIPTFQGEEHPERLYDSGRFSDIGQTMIMSKLPGVQNNRSECFPCEFVLSAGLTVLPRNVKSRAWSPEIGQKICPQNAVLSWESHAVSTQQKNLLISATDNVLQKCNWKHFD